MEFGGFYELPEFPCCDSTRSAFSWLTSRDKGTAVFVNARRSIVSYKTAKTRYNDTIVTE